MSVPLPPGLVLILAGLLLIPLRPGGLRTLVLLAAPLLALVLVAFLPEGNLLAATWLGLDLVPLRVDGLARLFGAAFCLAAFGGALFALRQESRTELPAAFVYAGAALGAVFAGDLVTLFLCWEAMALASTLVVWAGGPGARRAGMRYLAIHLLGGVLLMAGIAGHAAGTGSVAFGGIGTASVAGWLILAGFLVNAGAPPLSSWVADAYPKASWSGMVFLSAFTTKTAVLVLIRGFPGEPVLVWFGFAMVFYGIAYAILAADLRRMLAYSLVSQVGFMVVAVGIGSQEALAGASAQAFVHIVYKSLLVMAAGTILVSGGRRAVAELGGLWRPMPVTIACGAVGALAMAAVPLTGGFVAKGLIADAAPTAPLYMLVTAGSAGTVLYALGRLSLAVLAAPASAAPAADGTAAMRAAMLLFAALSVGFGLWPGLLMQLVPFPAEYAPYTAGHVVGQIQLVLFAGLAFLLLGRGMVAGRAAVADLDRLWRWLPAFLTAPPPPREGEEREWSRWRGLMHALDRQQRRGGLLARTWPTGSIALWAAILLAGWLLLYYF